MTAKTPPSLYKALDALPQLQGSPADSLVARLRDEAWAKKQAARIVELEARLALIEQERDEAIKRERHWIDFEAARQTAIRAAKD